MLLYRLTRQTDRSYWLRIMATASAILVSGWIVGNWVPSAAVRWQFPLNIAMGVGVVAVQRWGPRMWPGILIGGYVMEVVPPNAHSLLGSLPVAVIDVIAVLVTWWLIADQNRRRASLDNSSTSVLAVLWAGLFGALTWAALFLGWFYVAGRNNPYLPGPLTLLVLTWAGTAVPMIACLQLVVTHTGIRWREFRALCHGSLSELSGLLVLLGLTMLVVFVYPTLSLLVFIPVVWAIVRFHQAVSAWCLFVVVIGVTMCARLEIFGFPLENDSVTMRVISVESFNLLAIVLVLVFGAVVAERDTTALALENSLMYVARAMDKVDPLSSLRRGEVKRRGAHRS